MNRIKSDWLIMLAIVLPFIFVAVYWDQFPDQIPTHFDFSGHPDDYSDKTTGLFLLPGINLLMYFVFLFLPAIDPARKNYGLFAEKYKMIRVVLHLFFSFIFFVTATYSLGWQTDTSAWIMYGMLVLFVLLGNYMGSVRPNYFVGIRTPWTLSNEQVWIKTHRLAARVWVIGSLITMAVMPFVAWPEVLLIANLLVITLVPVIYSFVEFKKQTRHES